MRSGKNAIGQIISRFEEAGLRVVGAKMLHLSDAVAGGFYAEHKERPFLSRLGRLYDVRSCRGSGA